MRDHITLVLNGRCERVIGASPTTTLLQWLRREKRLTGTKEGCAEGDCGACTVVVGMLSGEGVRYEAINACIAFLPMLDGKSVTTVEGVASANGQMHPCQQALVDMHGSQCGFCTPGFVMSLYAMWLNHLTAPSVDRIEDQLAGNLCRCTGYGPIVAAAQLMFSLPRPQYDVEHRNQILVQLREIEHRDTLVIEGGGSVMFVPVGQDELAKLYLTYPDATLVAGATDVGLWVTKRNKVLSVIIHTGRQHDASVMTSKPRSAVPMHWLPSHTSHDIATLTLGKLVPAFAEVWRRFAGAQIRNAGTIGGNIANGSPIGDLAPGLIALGALLHLRRGDERRVIPLEDYFVAYGKQDRRPSEFITGIEIPGDMVATDLSIHKVSKRFDDDISAVCGAFNVRIEGERIGDARIAFGGMAGTPKRARAVEAALIGRPWTRETIDAALLAFSVDFSPISDVRASAAYRLQLAQNLLVRTFVERTDPAALTRLAGRAALDIGHGHD
jgi:xanthine dehydrogenase small subunit